MGVGIRPPLNPTIHDFHFEKYVLTTYTKKAHRQGCLMIPAPRSDTP